MWEEEQRCPSCLRRSRYGERHKQCGDCGLDGAVCFWAFEGLVKRIIHTVKTRHYFDMLKSMIPAVREIEARADMSKFRQFIEDGPIVVPVPVWPGREKKRGFNQAEIIAVKLAENFGLREDKLLISVKDVGEQQGRNVGQRLEAVRGAFAVRNTPGVKTAVIVDDVWSTGATLRECGRMLKAAGANKVWGWTLAG